MPERHPTSALTSAGLGGVALNPIEAIARLQRTLADDQEDFCTRYLAANLACLNLMVIELDKLIQLGTELERCMREVLGNEPIEQNAISNIYLYNKGLVTMNNEIKKSILLLSDANKSTMSEKNL